MAHVRGYSAQAAMGAEVVVKIDPFADADTGFGSRFKGV
jgi:hypothetical protein